MKDELHIDQIKLGMEGLAFQKKEAACTKAVWEDRELWF